MRFFRTPGRHFWALGDGRSLLWSPNLAETVQVENADLWPWISRLDQQLGHEGLELEGELLTVARFLQRQGYLLEAESPPAVEDDRRLQAFDWERWQKGEPGLHSFCGDGQGRGWCFWVEEGGCCLRCQVWRWLANLGAEQPLRWLQAAGVKPAWEGFSFVVGDALARAGREHRSLVWSRGQITPVDPLPLPGCSCCRPRLSFPVGGPHTLCSQQWRQNHPEGVLWGCRSGQVRLLGAPDGDMVEGAGFHEDSDLAYRSAVGEMLERYCAHFVPAPAPDSLERVDWRDFTDQQLAQPDFPYTDVTPRQWVPATDLADGRTVAVAAQAVLLCSEMGEERRHPSLSHGLCCHQSLQQALWGGLWECLERDAVASWWLQQGQPGEIPCRVGHCFVALERDSQGRLAFGSAAGPNSECARRARREALHNLVFLRQQEPRQVPRLPVSFAQHQRRYWEHPQDFPAGQPLPLAPRTAPSELAELARQLRDDGIRLYSVDLTTPDVAALGCTVVKVFSPDLLYLPARHDAWPMGRSRYRELRGSLERPEHPHPMG